MSASALGLVASGLALLDRWGATEDLREGIGSVKGLRWFLPALATVCVLGWSVPPIYMVSVLLCWGNDHDIGQGGLGLGLVAAFSVESWQFSLGYGAAWLAASVAVSHVDKSRAKAGRVP